MIDQGIAMGVATNFKLSVGEPSPLGAAFRQNQPSIGVKSVGVESVGLESVSTWNFAVFAPDATLLTLCLFCADTEEPLAELPFIGRTGDIWHMQVANIPEGTLYLLKADGADAPEQGLTFSSKHYLLDPYAKQLNRSLVFNERLYSAGSHFMLAKAVLRRTEFAWEGVTQPKIPREKTIIYEAHVKGMTALHPFVPAELRGTYLGMAHPAVVQHLVDLGVTTLQLLPVASFMSEPRLEKLHLTNYWGYNPICFMAPEPRYQLQDAVSEFKQLVKTYHAAGIEVILDVVFNHTAEADCYNICYRGLANRQYYLFENHADIPDYRNYSNYSGCGNTLNIAHPITQKLVLDSLRYWVTEMQVDGFRFDLAVTLAREHKRFNPYATFLQIIAQDPVLSQVKLIAEPWDVGPYGYQLGQFPAHWSELNDKFRDSVRSFWRQDQGALAEFTTRLLGSRDIFQKHHKPACCSVNYLAYHDGFTLHDLVCYQQKHNWLNAEQNRDGHNHNLSVNYGVEGPSTDADILAKRFLHKRNLVASLFLSQGMIHWLGGDELSQSQQGNNNAYCQDNELSWLHWDLDYHATQFMSFVQQMVKVRQQYPWLQQLSLLDDHYQRHGEKHHVDWYLASGDAKTEWDWVQNQANYCIFVISSNSEKTKMLVMMNACDTDLAVTLPLGNWHCILDTAHEMGLVSPVAIASEHYLQGANSLSLWLSEETFHFIQPQPEQ